MLYDADGDSVQTEFDIGSADGFIQVNQDLLFLEIYEGESEVGYYDILINLFDDSEPLQNTEYMLTLIVNEAEEKEDPDVSNIDDKYNEENEEIDYYEEVIEYIDDQIIGLEDLQYEEENEEAILQHILATVEVNLDKELAKGVEYVENLKRIQEQQLKQQNSNQSILEVIA